MKSLKVLDVTLRDGGCVNNFDFGTEYMEKIIHAQENAGIDIIELGYIDDTKGSENGRTQYISEKVIRQNILKNKAPGTKYVVMMDYGKYNVDNLEIKVEEGIDGIRLAFHKKDADAAIREAKTILAKGYEVFIQPMITLRYSDAELIELIQIVNDELPDASGFYIVDSFGEMRPNDMNRILNLVDHNLTPNMPVGFHSHNNLQMSYSNAVELLQFASNRDFLLDSSIMGMGKGAGNLNTELLLEHLNLFYGKSYDVNPLLDVMDKVLNQIHTEFYWGYSPEYYLSAINHCTPSYASYFYNKHMLPINRVSELLGLLEENKRISFDAAYAEEVYVKYNQGVAFDDKKYVDKLISDFKDKKVLLVGPGKQIKLYKERIENLIKSHDFVVVGLNYDMNMDIDYIITTRTESYFNYMKLNKALIVPSNITKECRGEISIIDYGKWAERKDRTWDTSAVLILNILRKAEPREIHIAGMDGFSASINDNYANPYLRIPLSEKEAKVRNDFYIDFIKGLREDGLKIIFETPSKYDL